MTDDMPRHGEPFEWAGLDDPNGTIIPDAILDYLMPHLGEAEFKVLMYIARRTFGWKKSADDISISQLVGGIVRRDGTRLDGGTGLSKHGVAKGLRGLLAKGIIVAQRNSSRERGNEPTTYAIRFRGTPLVPEDDKGGPPNALPPVPTGHPQPTALQPEGLERVWLRALGTLRPSMSAPNFATWFADTALVDLGTGTATVQAATYQQQGLERLERQLCRALAAASGQPITRCTITRR